MANYTKTKIEEKKELQKYNNFVWELNRFLLINMHILTNNKFKM